MSVQNTIHEPDSPRIMTDGQRSFLRSERQSTINVMVIFGLFFAFLAYIVISSLQQSQLIPALVIGVFAALFFFILVLSLYVLWLVQRDIIEGRIDKIEGIAKLSIDTYKSRGTEYNTHIVVVDKQHFTVPQEMYLRLKDGHSYRFYYTRYTKTLLFAEYDSVTGQGVQSLDVSETLIPPTKPYTLPKILSVIDETEVKLKREMKHGYRGVLYERFRRDTLTALSMFFLLSLPALCLGTMAASSPPELRKSNVGFLIILYCIPAGLIFLALLYDYAQLFYDVRRGTLKSVEGKIGVSQTFGSRYLNVTDLQHGGTKTFTISPEISEELVESQSYRVYYTPHSKIFVYAEPL
jgi:hypothetical protein